MMLGIFKANSLDKTVINNPSNNRHLYLKKYLFKYCNAFN